MEVSGLRGFLRTSPRLKGYASGREYAWLVSVKFGLQGLGLGFSQKRARAIFNLPKVLEDVFTLFVICPCALAKRLGQKARHSIGAITAHASEDKFLRICSSKLVDARSHRRADVFHPAWIWKRNPIRPRSHWNKRLGAGMPDA